MAWFLKRRWAKVQREIPGDRTSHNSAIRIQLLLQTSHHWLGTPLIFLPLVPPDLRNPSGRRNHRRRSIPGGRKCFCITGKCLSWGRGTLEMGCWTLWWSLVQTASLQCFDSATPLGMLPWKTTPSLPHRRKVPRWASSNSLEQRPLRNSPLPSLGGGNPMEPPLAATNWTAETVQVGENSRDAWGWNPTWFWVSFWRCPKNLAFSTGGAL